jgi:hypothetical protein
MDNIISRIEQRHLLRGRQTLILEGDQLKMELRRALSFHQYRFDLRGFLPYPLRVKRVPLARIIGASLLTVLSTVLLAAATSEEVGIGTTSPAVLSAVVLLILAALIWFSVVTGTVNVVLFQGPGGQFVLWPDYPDKEEFKEFLTVLSARIRNTQHPGQNLLRQLRCAEIIDDWQFEQAMELLEQKGIAGRPGNPSLEE